MTNKQLDFDGSRIKNKTQGKKMKKVLLTALVAFGLVASFSGCQKKEAPVAQEANKTDANKTEANATKK